MADEPKVIIVRFKGLVSSDDTDEEKKPSKKSQNSLTTGLRGLQKAMHPLKTLTSHNHDEEMGLYFAKETAKTAMSFVSTITQYTISRYFRLSEDYKSENYLNNVMGNINRAKSFANNAVSGAIGGSQIGGVLGAVLGASISSATTAFNQYVSYQNQIANYEQSLNATRVETVFKAQRAGLYDGGKGTEN